MIVTPSASFTRPADTTQYAAGDLVANSTTAASVVPLKFNISDITLRRGVVAGCVFIKSDETDVTSASFKVHLFTSEPTVTNGDNGAFQVATAVGYIGSIACDISSGALVTVADVGQRFQLSSTNDNATLLVFDIGQTNTYLYGLIEARGTYTPASGEVFTVKLEIGNDGGIS